MGIIDSRVKTSLCFLHFYKISLAYENTILSDLRIKAKYKKEKKKILKGFGDLEVVFLTALSQTEVETEIEVLGVVY